MDLGSQSAARGAAAWVGDALGRLEHGDIGINKAARGTREEDKVPCLLFQTVLNGPVLS